MRKMTKFSKRLVGFAACVLVGLVSLPLTASAMQVFVKATEQKAITLEVETSDEIEAVKEKIQEKEGIVPSMQCLVYGGRILQEGRTLADYDIQKDSTIQLLLKTELLQIKNQFHKTYDGNVVEPEVQLADAIANERYDIQWYEKDGTFKNELAYPPVNAGEYVVRVFLKSDATVYVEKEISISQKELLVAPEVENKKYDGNKEATVKNIILHGVVQSDDLRIEGGVATFATAEPGENITVNFEGFTLAGEDAKNYKLIVSKDVKADIIAVESTDKIQKPTTDNTGADTSTDANIGTAQKAPATGDSNDIFLWYVFALLASAMFFLDNKKRMKE